MPNEDDPVLTDTMKYQVRMVKIVILARTASEHRGYSNVRPGIEDNPEGATADGYRRKLLQVTVDVRNMGLS